MTSVFLVAVFVCSCMGEMSASHLIAQVVNHLMVFCAETKVLWMYLCVSLSVWVGVCCVCKRERALIF